MTFSRNSVASSPLSLHLSASSYISASELADSYWNIGIGEFITTCESVDVNTKGLSYQDVKKGYTLLSNILSSSKEVVPVSCSVLRHTVWDGTYDDGDYIVTGCGFGVPSGYAFNWNGTRLYASVMNKTGNKETIDSGNNTVRVFVNVTWAKGTIGSHYQS